MKHNLISFFTIGHPTDRAKDFRLIAEKFNSEFSKHFDKIKLYNSSDFINDTLFMEHVINYIPPKLSTSLPYPQEHNRGINHAYWRWKPYIIAKALNEMNFGEILIYQDINVERYPNFLIDIENYKENVEHLFNNLNNDVLVATEDINLHCEKHVKSEIFEKIGFNNKNYRKFPLLHANRIFIRKSNTSVLFINEWLDYCKTDLILPEDSKESNLKWSTHDQAILTVLYKKYIELQIFNNRTFKLNNFVFSKKNIIFL